MSNVISLETIRDIFEDRAPGVIGKYRFFSVLVPLVEKDGHVHLLYEVRAEHMKRQPKEVCFPGGHLEEGETPMECAVRETCEELGIKEQNVRIINQLDTLHSYSNFTMYAFLGVIKWEVLEAAIVNPEEVKEIFLVPLEHLLEQEPVVYNMEVHPVIGDDFPYHLINFDNGYFWRYGVSDVPIYRYDGHPIWGLTGRITRNFIHILKAEGVR